MAGRLLAIVLVIGLIAGAFVWRGRSSEPGGPSGNPVNLICVTEATSACDAIAAASKGRVAVKSEAAQTTAVALSKGSPTGVDGWIAPPAWIEMVRAARQRNNAGEDLHVPSKTIARSPLLLIAEKSRASVMRANCNNDVTWKCTGDVMNRRTWSALKGGRPEWGQVKIGWGNPETSSSGLATLGSVTAGYFGRSDVDAFDLDDGAYSQWLTAASSSLVRTNVDALTTMLTSGPALYNAVSAPESAVAPLLKTAARAQEFDSIYPGPHTTLDLSYAAIGTSGRLGDLVDKYGKAAFQGASWRLPDKATTDLLRNDVGMGPTDSLLSAGAMERLHTKWQQELAR